MNILHIIDTLNIGGAERVLVTLANIFSQRKHNIDVLTILTPGPLANELMPEIKIQSLNRKWKFNPVVLYKLSVIADRYDIVHIHMRHDLRYVFLAKIIFGFRAKIVSHDHYGDILLDPAVSMYSKYILRRVTYTAVSQDLIDWAVNKVGLSRDKITLLSNIVQIKKIDRTSVGSKANNLLMVANIRPAKNIEFALEIMKSLNHSRRSYTLDIVCQINDRNYYHRIQKLINEYDLSDQIRLIHDCFDVQSIISSYSLAIHTAKSESGPLVLIEYLGHHLPFLTFGAGMVVGQIQNDLPELIMNTFNVDDWCDQITKLADQNKNGTNAQLLERMQNVFEQKYSEEQYYKKCFFIYKSAIQ